MKIAILKEVAAGETRVAMVPETVKRLVQSDSEVRVEAGAGGGAFIRDDQYAAAGAEVVSDPSELCGWAELVIKINPPADDGERNELEMLPGGTTLICLLRAESNAPLVRCLAERNVTTLALERVPRITRAQSMDVLTSMSTLAGYRAVLLAAGRLGRIFPLMMTAAGTIPPAKVLVIGAGVAGLQAIATAHRLGAMVKGVDTRPAVGEQVESLGAKFVELDVEHAEAETTGGYAADLGEQFYRAEQDVIAPHAAEADAIVTTALIPGKPAPILITDRMIEKMKPGSVIVDLAAPMGGNCSDGKPDEPVETHGVTILSPTNLPADMPIHASLMFSRNVAALIEEISGAGGELTLDTDSEVVAGMTITRDGQIVDEATREAQESEEV